MISRLWRPAAALLAAGTLAFGCDEGDPRSDAGADVDDSGVLAAWCDRSLWPLAWDVEGLPPPGTAPNWIPNPRVPFERPPGGTTTHIWMPWDLNDRQAYFLRSGEDVHLRLQFMAGADLPATGTVHVRVFIDGRLSSLSHEGMITQELLTELSDGLAQTEIELPRDEFRDGLNSVHVNIRYDFGAPDRLYPDDGFWSFSVARNLADSGAEFEETPGFDVENAAAGYGTRIFLEDETRGELDLFRWTEGLPWTGEEISVVIREQADPAIDPCGVPPLEDTFALVALLDGEEVPWGDIGSIIGRIPPSEQHVRRVQIHLPRDGATHVFEAFTLSGLGRPARLQPRRSVPPWRGVGARVMVLKWSN